MNPAEKGRRWRQAHPERPLVYDARRRARARGIPFDITHGEVQEIISSWTCTYCGTLVGTFAGGLRPQSATLDRLVPELGYVKGNVCLACHACNSAKGEHTLQSLRAWADKLEGIINRNHPTRMT
ncbi:MAG: hypothetical protein H0W74_14090 [Sphingosinicella sp.]|nr:hypothetical protein [Sphingosinicella sp.]